MPLKDYTEVELIEELARRAANREKSKPKKWCSNCSNFKCWKGVGNDVPEEYNPCTKGHKMSFAMPEYETDDDYGFYRGICADRTENAVCD